MIKILLLTLCLVILPSKADTIQGIYEIAEDRDGVYTKTKGAEWLHKQSDSFNHGIRVQNISYELSPYKSSKNGILYVFDKTWNKSRKTIGQVGYDGSAVFGYIQHNEQFHKNWMAEVFAEKGAIDSVPALNKELYSSIYGVGLSYDNLDRFAMAAVLMKQVVNDGNAKDHKKLVGLYTLSKDFGIHLRGEYKTYTSEFYTRDYFNPQEYSSQFIGLTHSKWYGDNKLSLMYMLGSESINNVVTNGMAKYEVKYMRINSGGDYFIEAVFGSLFNDVGFTYYYGGLKYTHHY